MILNIIGIVVFYITMWSVTSAWAWDRTQDIRFASIVGLLWPLFWPVALISWIVYKMGDKN